jgi:hypothetical protein
MIDVKEAFLASPLVETRGFKMIDAVFKPAIKDVSKMDRV